MSLKIDSDLGRFKDIIRGKVKSNIKKFASSADIIGQQGAKTVKIPLTNIDLPRFAFGGKGQGGPGMGDGDIGDPMGPGKSKPGKGKAGDGSEEHDFSMEFSTDELAQILSEALELPKLEDKGKGGVSSEKSKYNQISRTGNDGLRHFKRTYKEALKRQISMGNYNPQNPVVVPIKSDFRFKTYSTKEVPDVNAVVINIMDVSGSMAEEQKHIAKSIIFWTDLLLNAAYKGIENVFIIHDTEAQVVSREDFFKVSSGGGTKISPAYKLCAQLIEEQYPFSEWNNYVFHFSDGDNYSNEDDLLCKGLLNGSILPNSNMFAYGQIKSQQGSGDFINYLSKEFGGNDDVVLSEINGVDDILGAIKTFFDKGK